ncbi:MAG: MerR family transcriptional regulator [Rhodospirillaceae bacterium]|nr:MAG: MerR family transcriptional regulator [Rhodospirillaceae bacterium]
MSNKSDQAFRTISEVAEFLDLPQHVLRFWETKFRQVSPLKRGGGRRYYRPQDVELLSRIKSLLHTEGYTIKGVQRMLGQGGVKNLPPASVVIAKAEEGAEARPALNLEAQDLSSIVTELEDISTLLKQASAD